nr:MCE family protein [Paracoccaceae bacterium]
MTDAGPHDPVVEAPRAERASRRVSAVWLVPLIALAISLAVAWRSYSDRGPVIEIVLADAAGIEAGKTALRFRNVNIGIVEDLRFTDDLRQVIATARVAKDMARYLDASAEFWVVRPSVSAQGVTGIETVLSGVYIEAFWDGAAGPRVEAFTALPRPPLTPADQPGRRVRLRATDGGSISIGAPVLFKRIPVGRVENVELTETGDVAVDLFVNAPYDAFLTSGARFWNASGFSINLGAGGASLNVESLVSLLQGGIAFAQVGSELAPVEEGHVFELYPSEAVARQNVIEDLPGARVTLNAFFDASVSGLVPGARVEFRGVTVGEVTAFQPVILRTGGGPQLVMRVTLAVLPQRLGVPAEEGDPAQAGLDLLAALVEDGLRAQLASSGLLSQSLYVALAELPTAEPASLDRDAQPYPVIPTAPSEVSGIAASAEGVMNRIAALPIEELMSTFTTLLANVNVLVSDEGFRSASANIGALIADIREVVETSGIKDTPAQIAATLASIQAVVAEVETREVMTALADTIETTRVTIEKFGVAAEGVPALI